LAWAVLRDSCNLPFFPLEVPNIHVSGMNGKATVVNTMLEAVVAGPAMTPVVSKSTHSRKYAVKFP
jgi:hypothetical protein